MRIQFFFNIHKSKRNGLYTFRAKTSKYTMPGSMQKQYQYSLTSAEE